MIYSEAERKEIERVYGVFKDYIHASKFLDFVWSEKLGYLLLHIDPTKNTIEEDQIICISSKGFNQRDAYRVMLRKYPDVMNIEQMCDALKVSTKTGYKLLHEGKIPAMKIGRSYRIPKAHLFTYLQICGQHCQAKNRQC